MKSRLVTAITLAALAHDRQKDKGGLPYILHPLRVMCALPINDEEGQIAAVLHDVVEDCGFTLDYIALVFGQEVADTVDALSRREDETYSDFILRCKAHPKARAIKILDIQDNMRVDRAGQLSEDERASMAKRYLKALAVLADVRITEDFAWYQGQVDRGIIREIVSLKRVGKL